MFDFVLKAFSALHLVVAFCISLSNFDLLLHAFNGLTLVPNINSDCSLPIILYAMTIDRDIRHVLMTFLRTLVDLMGSYVTFITNDLA